MHIPAAGFRLLHWQQSEAKQISYVAKPVWMCTMFLGRKHEFRYKKPTKSIVDCESS